MVENSLGFCGLNCRQCPVFIATANNDDKLRQKTAKEWSELYTDYLDKRLEQKDINCKGCWSETGIFIGCSHCPIRKCSKENSFNSCAECNKYETCPILNGFFSDPNHQQAKRNLDRIRVEKE